MTAARLLILGTLARNGPMHGHQIRKEAQTSRVELWTDVKAGSLYAGLARMAAEGVIEQVRTERDGNMPVRTVYGITEKGLQELGTQREAALREAGLRPDPVDLALHFSQEAAEPDLVAAFTARRAALAGELESWRRLRETAAPHLSGVEPLVLEHQIFRLEAEVAWHDKVLTDLPAALASGAQNRPHAHQDAE